jgi:insulysin
MMTAVEHDVEFLEPLTKEDLISFYDEFIAPSSATRAKVAVHLVAQGTPAAVLENATPETKAKLIMAALTQFLDAQGIPANPEQLARRFVDVNLADANPAPLVGAVMTYLTEDAKVPAAQATSVVQQGMLLMQAAQAKGEEQTLLTSEKPAPVVSHPGTKPTLIEDVRAFKASLQLSLGPQPAKDLIEYEDTEAKL